MTYIPTLHQNRTHVGQTYVLEEYSVNGRNSRIMLFSFDSYFLVKVASCYFDFTHLGIVEVDKTAPNVGSGRESFVILQVILGFVAAFVGIGQF